MGQQPLHSLYSPQPFDQLSWYASEVDVMSHYIEFASQWFGSALLGAALAWLVYRASQVLLKPNDELVALLGIDVPIAPTLSLAGLRADGFILHWQQREQRVVVNYHLSINGRYIGDLSNNEPTIEISGLPSNRGYVVRITATNSNKFSANSEPIYLKTKPAATGDFGDTRTETNADADEGIHAIIRSYRPLPEPPTNSHGATPMQREHSGSISRQQRNSGARRYTQTAQSPEPVQTEFAPMPENEEVIRSLNGELDRIRSDNEQVNASIEAEVEASKKEIEAKEQELQAVNQQLQDKQNATKKLNQQVAALHTEELNARRTKENAQQKLNQAIKEREKMQADMNRWKQECDEAKRNIAKMDKDTDAYIADMEKKTAALRAKIEEEKSTNKILEDGLKQAVAKISAIETETQKMKESMDQNNPRAIQEEEEAFKRQNQDLIDQWHSLTYRLQQAKIAYAQNFEIMERYRIFHEAHAHNAHTQAQAQGPTHTDTLPQRSNSGRLIQPLMRSERSSTFPSHEPSQHSPFNMPMGSIGQTFNSSTPFFTLGDGMINSDSMATSNEQDNILGAGPASPSVVGGLLPSGLLGDDLESRFGSSRSGSARDVSLDTALLPGLGAPETLEQSGQGPNSPVSLHSRSPSIFTSPRGSTTQLPGTGSLGDVDGRSIRSNKGSVRAVSGSASGTRFASLLNLGRQRTKAGSDEGLVLGRLRRSETQSLPRQDLVDISEAGGNRRRGSHSGPGWVGQMLGRANTSASMDDSKKRVFGMFGNATRKDIWPNDNAEGSRPVSVSSSEGLGHGLPRPTSESVSKWGWPAQTEFGSQRSILGTDWGVPNNDWSSRLHSRNTSAQHPLLGGEIDMQDDDTKPRPIQAPIGTRPRSSQASSESRPATSALKLNPAAPSFKAIFGRSSTDRKADKASKGKGHSKNASLEINPSASAADIPAPLPTSSSRKSRDAASISTADYDGPEDPAAADPRASLDHSVSSAAASDGGASMRESFMQKLTRKSSAGFSTITGGLRVTGKAKASASADAEFDNDDSPITPVAAAAAAAVASVEDPAKSGQSPALGSGARGFSFRNLRRRKDGKAAEERSDAETVDDATEEERD